MLEVRETLHVRCSPVCNLKCPYCFSTERQKGKLCDFPLDVIDWVMQRYRFRQFVMLCGEGETTLCPNFEELVDKCLSYPIPQLQMLTHGKGRTFEWWKEFIDKHRDNPMGIGLTWHPGQDNLDACLRIIEYVNDSTAQQKMFQYLKVVVTEKNFDEVVESFLNMSPRQQRELYFHFDYTNREEEASVRRALEERLRDYSLRVVHVEVCGDERYLSEVNKDSVAVTLGDNKVSIVDRDYNWKDTLIHEEYLCPTNNL